MANFEFNTFIKGLVTDVNPLTFPENTSKDELNFVLNKDGSRQRRLGLDWDNNPSTPIIQDGYTQSYLWKNVNSTGLSIFVVQAGFSLAFHKIDSTGILPKFAEILFDEMQTGNYGDGEQIKVSMADGFGRLFVVGKHIQPFSVEFRENFQGFDVFAIDIKIRDLEGVEDGFEPDHRPTAEEMNDEHTYNLTNQGWGDSFRYQNVLVVQDQEVSGPFGTVFTKLIRQVTERTNTGTIGNTRIASYFNKTGRFPSNSQIWTIGKDAEDNFDPELLNKMDFGTSFAPKGRHIIDPFFQQRDALPVRVERSRPDSVAFFNGRVFYAGIEADKTNLQEDQKSTNLTTGHLFFSQIVSDISRAGKCYQEADPTSEHISDLIADDGGVIILSGCGKILNLIDINGALLVIANNGVWEVSGVDSPFSADNYQVSKISEFGAITSDFVRYESSVFFLSETDVMMVTPVEGGGLVTRSMTDGVINNYYRTIPSNCKLEAKLSFDPSDKVLMILHGKDGELPRKRTELLMHNFTLGAWFKHSFTLPEGNTISSVTYVNEALSTFIEDNVLVGTDQVLVEAEAVVVDTPLPSVATPQLRFMVCDCDNYRFAFMRDNNFRDFNIVDSYKSYLITGVNTFGDTMRNKNIEYLVTTMKRTEKQDAGEVVLESSCLLSTRWDFSDSTSSGKWSQPQQVYRYTRFFIPEGEDLNYGQEVIQTKNKVRGTGRALSFVFESEEGKDLHLYGWAVAMGGRRYV